MKQPICKHCGSETHYSLMCFQKPRKKIHPVSSTTYFKRKKMRRAWFEKNPPDGKGVWICYLQISPNCPKKVTYSTINLEHVKSKVRYPELRYDLDNIKPACSFCNTLKGSKDVDEL